MTTDRWRAPSSLPLTSTRFFYSSGTLLDLGTLGGTFSVGFEVNDSGEVTGMSSEANGDNHGFIYSGGTMHDLGTLGGPSSEGDAINANGDIAGSSTNAGLRGHAFLYSGGVMHDLGTLGGTDSQARALNNSDQVTGCSTDNTGNQLAFFYDGATMSSWARSGEGVVAVLRSTTAVRLPAYPASRQEARPVTRSFTTAARYMTSTAW
jgi:probable HAF family extracellular repeat protein